jgi:Ca2+/Na+ antiporter
MLNIALFVTCIVAYFVLLDQYIEGWLLMTIYVSLTVILIPVYYRLSRMIWINFFESYHPEKRGTR